MNEEEIRKAKKSRLGDSWPHHNQKPIVILKKKRFIETPIPEVNEPLLLDLPPSEGIKTDRFAELFKKADWVEE
jgi:hypothetical protein